MIRYILVALFLLAPTLARADERSDLEAQLAAIQAKLAAMENSYDAAVKASIAKGQPLVVFIGMDFRRLPGMVSCHSEYLTGYPNVCAVVGVPLTGQVEWRATLEGAAATDANIRAAARPKAVQPAAAFFEQVVPRDADGNSMLPVGSVESLAEVNAWRVRRGLVAFIRDDGLTIAAARCAHHRAMRLIAGHANDFAFLPAGVSADTAGCGAWPVGLVTTTGETFGACATDSVGYRFAGAAWVMGSDGRRYMQLHLRR